jgi:hypothetical protein
MTPLKRKNSCTFKRETPLEVQERIYLLEAPNAENPAGDCTEKRLGVCCQLTGRPKRKSRFQCKIGSCRRHGIPKADGHS